MGAKDRGGATPAYPPLFHPLICPFFLLQVDAVFVAFFGQTGAACVDRDSFRRAMLNWLALHDDRPHIFRYVSHASPCIWIVMYMYSRATKGRQGG